MQAQRARTTGRGPAPAAPVRRRAEVPLPSAVVRRTGIPADAASGKNRSGTAPPPGPRRRLQRRSRAPLLPPSVNCPSVLGPQHGFGERVDRNVTSKISIEYRSEQKGARALERQL